MIKSSSQLVKNALEKIDEISVNQLFQKQKKDIVKIIDVREANEIANGVIPGSVWVSRGLLEFQIESIVKQHNWNIEDEVYICCRSGNRSALAALSLLEMGFKKPISVAGGFTAWLNKDYVVSKDLN